MSKNKPSFKQLLSQLNPEQLEFIKTKKIDATFKIKHWIGLFGLLAEFDEKGDKLRKNYNTGRVSFILAGIVAGIIGCGFYPIFILAAIFGGVAIFLHIKHTKLKALDLSDHFRMFVYPLLIVLREEAGKDSYVKLNLNVSPVVDKSNLLQTIPNTNKSYPKTEINIYRAVWLESKITLRDNTEFEMQCTDIVQKKTINKRSASGKSKTKTKHKTKHFMKGSLDFDKNRYKATIGSKVTDNPENYAYKFKIKDIKATSPSVPDIKLVLGAIMEGYKNMQPV